MVADGSLGAAELAELVREGQISAVESVEAAVRRIERDGSALNAFVEFDGDRAVADARHAPRGPLAGVPIAVKANTAVEGWICDHGSRLLAEYRPDHSAYVVDRLRAAGAVVVGTTRMPEFGALGTTEPLHGGAVRNPWDPDRTTGGSSGGSAAVVAARLLAVAHGTDGAGSLRIPAACCGLVGMKVTRGRVSHGPDRGESALIVHGLLSHTVADTAAVLDVMAGYEVGDATWAPRPAEPFTIVARRPPARLRIAASAANVIGVPVDPIEVDAVRQVAETLSGLGHHVEEVDPDLPPADLLGIFISVYAANRGFDLATAARLAGHEPGEDDVEPLSRALYDLGRSQSAVDHLRHVAELQARSRQLIAFFADWDVLLTPALAQRPLPVGACHGAMDDPMSALGVAAQFAPYAALYNVTGQPAVSVPAGLGPDGLPTAVQLAGAPLAEDTLLQLATQLEKARPWADLRPLAPQPGAAA